MAPVEIFPGAFLLQVAWEPGEEIESSKINKKIFLFYHSFNFLY